MTPKQRKRSIIVKEILVHHHPDFKNLGPRNIVLRRPEIVDVEGMVEEAMAHVGGYKFVDMPHYDFSDGTEGKTATKYHTGRVEISGVSSSTGIKKSGDLRVVAVDPSQQKIRYYYIPIDFVGFEHEERLFNICINNNSKGRIYGYWDHPKLEQFNVGSFEHLAKRVP